MTVSSLICSTPTQAAVNARFAITGTHAGSRSGLLLTLGEDMEA